MEVSWTATNTYFHTTALLPREVSRRNPDLKLLPRGCLPAPHQRYVDHQVGSPDMSCSGSNPWSTDPRASRPPGQSTPRSVDLLVSPPPGQSTPLVSGPPGQWTSWSVDPWVSGPPGQQGVGVGLAVLAGRWSSATSGHHNTH